MVLLRLSESHGESDSRPFLKALLLPMESRSFAGVNGQIVHWLCSESLAGSKTSLLYLVASHPMN